VESERVDWPDVVDVVYRLAMTFERVLFLLDGWRGVEVFHSNAAFDGRGRITWKKGIIW